MLGQSTYTRLQHWAGPEANNEPHDKDLYEKSLRFNNSEWGDEIGKEGTHTYPKLLTKRERQGFNSRTRAGQGRACERHTNESPADDEQANTVEIPWQFCLK